MCFTPRRGHGALVYPRNLSAGAGDVGIVQKKSEFSTNAQNLPECLCHSLPGWREVKKSMACAPPVQSSSAGQGGSMSRPCPQPGIKAHVELISQRFSCTGKEKEIAATSQWDFSFSLWEGTAWLLLCSSHTSCGRHWQCSGTSLLKLPRSLDPSRLFRGHFICVAPPGQGSIWGWNQRTWNSHSLKLWSNNEDKKPVLGALNKRGSVGSYSGLYSWDSQLSISFARMPRTQHRLIHPLPLGAVRANPGDSIFSAQPQFWREAEVGAQGGADTGERPGSAGSWVRASKISKSKCLFREALDEGNALKCKIPGATCCQLQDAAHN